ncbi:MAG: insulinase family protein [Rhodospirillaceae bacterium]|nr:insulinase family protein [Rhodospirillaceae bacterium]
MRLRLLLPALAAVLGLGLQPAKAVVYGAETFTLANGMQVVVIPNHRAPVVSHMVFYRAGAAEDLPGKSGIAHFLEHLMFKGTPKYPAGAVMDVVARNGGNQNAFTTRDYTGYYQNIAADRLPLMMDMEADRMRNLILNKSIIDTEREVIIEERRMRVDNVPASILQEKLDAGLWMYNHYAIPIIGWEPEMHQLTDVDAKAYYDAHYTPNNAILVVAGDITMAALKPLAEKYYGAIPLPKGVVAKPTTRARDTYLYPPSANRVVMHDERVSQPQWVKQFIAPSYNVGDRTDVHALEVFADLIGGGSTAKLYRSLVVDQKVAAGVSASYDAEAVSYGVFYLSLTPSPGVELAKAEGAFDATLAALLKDGITDADVARAKGRMAARLAFAKDSPMSAARAVGTSLASGVSLADIENWPDAMNKVTTEQVRAAARKLFATASSATGILLPAEEKP